MNTGLSGPSNDSAIAIASVVTPYVVRGIRGFRFAVVRVIQDIRNRRNASEQEVIGDNLHNRVNENVLQACNNQSSQNIGDVLRSMVNTVNQFPSRDCDGFVVDPSVNTPHYFPNVGHVAADVNFDGSGTYHNPLADFNASTQTANSFPISVDTGTSSQTEAVLLTPEIVEEAFANLPQPVVDTLDSLHIIDFLGVLNVPANLFVRYLLVKGIYAGIEGAQSVANIYFTNAQKEAIANKAVIEQASKLFPNSGGGNGGPSPLDVRAEILKRAEETSELYEKTPWLIKFMQYLVGYSYYLIAGGLVLLVIGALSFRIYKISLELKAIQEEEKLTSLTDGNSEDESHSGKI